MTNYKRFYDLHFQAEPLILGNVWNAQSAKIYESLNFKAIGTSSAAIAKTLGYNDGEEMPFDNLLFMVDKISKATNLPLTVDLEAGYGHTAAEIITNILKIHKLGVAGINLEDSEVTDGIRQLKDANEFSALLSAITNKLKELNAELFINVRTDTFLLNISDKLDETKRRITLYEQTNAKGIFLPCITNPTDIETIITFTKLPVNVMCMPELPNFEVLTRMGVKRISMGHFLNEYSYSSLETVNKNIIQYQSFQPLFAK